MLLLHIESDWVVLLEMLGESSLWLPAFSSCLDVSRVLLHSRQPLTSSHAAKWLRKRLSFGLLHHDWGL